MNLIRRNQNGAILCANIYIISVLFFLLHSVKSSIEFVINFILNVNMQKSRINSVPLTIYKMDEIGFSIHLQQQNIDSSLRFNFQKPIGIGGKPKRKFIYMK